MGVDKILAQEYDFIKSVCLKLTADEFDADDLAQEVMIAAFRFWDKFDGVNVRGWLHTIAKRMFINSYRKKQRSNEVLVEDIMGALSEDAIDFDFLESEEDTQPDQRLASELYLAIDKLSPKYKQVFVLVVVYGHTYQEVAEMKEVPIGTVKSILFKAKRELRELLGGVAKERGVKYHLEK